MNENFEKRMKVNFWKPNKSGNGAAAMFEFNPASRPVVFLTMMPQMGGDEESRKFDRDKRLIMQLGLNDVSAMVTVLTNRVEGLGARGDKGYQGLFHKNPRGSSILGLSIKNEGEGYWLSLSTDRDGSKNRLSVGLTIAEAEQLLTYMRTIMPYMFVDDFGNEGGEPEKPPAKTSAPKQSSNDEKVVSRKPVGTTPF